MECPVCFKLPRGQIFQCERGHHVCSDCRAKLTDCPVCRIPLGQSRNLLAEKILAKMSHTCKFTTYGCTFEEKIAALESHEQDCKHRLICCPSLHCKTRVSMAQLLQHLEDKHQVAEQYKTTSKTLRSKTNLEVKLDRTHDRTYFIKPVHMQVGDRHFFREALRTTDGRWYMWLYMLGSKKDC